MRTSSTYIVETRQAYIDLILYLYDRRKVIVKNWQSAIDSSQKDLALMFWHPYFMRTFLQFSERFAFIHGPKPMAVYFSLDRDLAADHPGKILSDLTLEELKEFAKEAKL